MKNSYLILIQTGIDGICFKTKVVLFLSLFSKTLCKGRMQHINTQTNQKAVKKDYRECKRILSLKCKSCFAFVFWTGFIQTFVVLRLHGVTKRLSGSCVPPVVNAPKCSPGNRAGIQACHQKDAGPQQLCATQRMASGKEKDSESPPHKPAPKSSAGDPAHPVSQWHVIQPASYQEHLVCSQERFQWEGSCSLSLAAMSEAEERWRRSPAALKCSFVAPSFSGVLRNQNPN